MVDIAHLLTVTGSIIMGCGLTALGLCCLVAPGFAAEAYGIPIGPQDAVARSWVEVAGVRDFGLGVATLAVFFTAPRAMRTYAPSLMLIAGGDALVTYRSGGSFVGVATHLGGTACIAVLTVAAWLDAQLDAAPGKKKK